MPYPILAPRDTWYTQGGTSIKRSTITEINIKDSYTPVGAVTAQWDGSAAKDGSITVYVEGTKLTIAGNGSGKIQANEDSSRCFSNHDKNDRFRSATIQGLDSLDVSMVSNMTRMFNESKIQNVDFMKSWDFASLIDATAMFDKCSSITDVSLSDLYFPKLRFASAMFNRLSNAISIAVFNWNTPSLTKIAYFATECSKMTRFYFSGVDVSHVTTFSHFLSDNSMLHDVHISNIDTSSCLNFGAMFNDCHSLEYIDVSALNTSSALALSQMFERCPSLKKIDGLQNFSTENLGLYEVEEEFGLRDRQTGISEMFMGCSSLVELDLSSFTFTKINPAYQNEFYPYADAAFMGCTKLKTIMLAQPMKICNGYRMFKGCTALTDCDFSLIDTSECFFFNEMFSGCSSLKSVDLSKWDSGTSINFSNMFFGCGNLSKIALGSAIKYDGSIDPPAELLYMTLPTPDPAYIPGADGNWYDLSGKSYTPENAVKTVPNIYFASKQLVRDEPVMLKNGTLIDIGDAVRMKKGDGLYRIPSEMADAIKTI